MVIDDHREKLPRLPIQPGIGRKTNYPHQRPALRRVDQIATPPQHQRQRKLGSPLWHHVRHCLQPLQRDRLVLLRTFRPAAASAGRGTLRPAQATQMLCEIRDTARLFPHHRPIKAMAHPLHTTRPYQQTLAELQANKKTENKPRTKIGYIKPAED